MASLASTIAFVYVSKCLAKKQKNKKQQKKHKKNKTNKQAHMCVQSKIQSILCRLQGLRHVEAFMLFVPIVVYRHIFFWMVLSSADTAIITLRTIFWYKQPFYSRYCCLFIDTASDSG